jgi:hypothetical protein
LSDGVKLSDLEIQLAILPGVVREREKQRLSERAIGGIWWLPKERFVHGSIYIDADDYATIWGQVLDGEYVDCGIDLAVDPVKYIEGEPAWIDNPLCIESANVYFQRKTLHQTQANNKPIEKGVFAYSRRWWAVLLFFMAVAAWYYPQWNGRFFEPSKDVTTGEGRIAAAVMFVGGLLLWFLRET